jgi:hypothetical protein
MKVGDGGDVNQVVGHEFAFSVVDQLSLNLIAIKRRPSNYTADDRRGVEMTSAPLGAA